MSLNAQAAIRRDPDGASTRFVDVPGATVLKVLDFTDEGDTVDNSTSWYLVDAQPAVGWVHASALSCDIGLPDQCPCQPAEVCLWDNQCHALNSASGANQDELVIDPFIGQFDEPLQVMGLSTAGHTYVEMQVVNETGVVHDMQGGPLIQGPDQDPMGFFSWTWCEAVPSDEGYYRVSIFRRDAEPGVYITVASAIGYAEDGSPGAPVCSP